MLVIRSTTAGEGDKLGVILMSPSLIAHQGRGQCLLLPRKATPQPKSPSSLRQVLTCPFSLLTLGGMAQEVQLAVALRQRDAHQRQDANISIYFLLPGMRHGAAILRGNQRLDLGRPRLGSQAGEAGWSEEGDGPRGLWWFTAR